MSNKDYSANTIGHQWNLDQASKIYGINHWGNNYFGIDSLGNVVVKNQNNEEASAVSLIQNC